MLLINLRLPAIGASHFVSHLVAIGATGVGKYPSDVAVLLPLVIV